MQPTAAPPASRERGTLHADLPLDVDEYVSTERTGTGGTPINTDGRCVVRYYVVTIASPGLFFVFVHRVLMLSRSLARDGLSRKGVIARRALMFPTSAGKHVVGV